MSQAFQLRTFIRAIHRRWVIWRTIERAGIGIFIACAMTAVLLPVLLWRGQPAMPMILGAIGAGAICGAVFGLKHRPTLTEAAMEADRQFNLHDLLASALSVDIPHADEWSAAVVAMAEARCRGIAPRAVILNRLGARSWGGIAISTAFMLTLGLLSTNPIVTEVIASASGREAQNRGQMETATPEKSPAVPARRSPSPLREPVGDDHSEIADSSTSTRGSVEASNQRPATSTDGAGGGRANSDSRSEVKTARSATLQNALSELGKRTASGGAANAQNAAHGETAGTNASATRISPVPAWKSDSWKTAREQALHNVREGKAPAGYRDLIQDYFSHDDVDH